MVGLYVITAVYSVFSQTVPLRLDLGLQAFSVLLLGRSEAFGSNNQHYKWVRCLTGYLLSNIMLNGAIFYSLNSLLNLPQIAHKLSYGKDTDVTWRECQAAIIHTRSANGPCYLLFLGKPRLSPLSPCLHSQLELESSENGGAGLLEAGFLLSGVIPCRRRTARQTLTHGGCVSGYPKRSRLLGVTDENMSVCTISHEQEGNS